MTEAQNITPTAIFHQSGQSIAALAWEEGRDGYRVVGQWGKTLDLSLGLSEFLLLRHAVKAIEFIEQPDDAVPAEEVAGDA